MDELDLFQIKRRLANATPGPWFVEGSDKRENTRINAPNHNLTISTSEIHSPSNHLATVWNVSCTCIQGHQYDNQEFIAHSITDIQLLLDKVVEQNKIIQEQKSIIAGLTEDTPND